MNASQRYLNATPAADDARLWYPLHPRWIPLLRIVGVLGVICALYHLVLDRSWSLHSLVRWVIPALLILSCLFVQPELRPRSVLNRVGRIAHLLLVFFVLPLALLAILVRWLPA